MIFFIIFALKQSRAKTPAQGTAQIQSKNNGDPTSGGFSAQDGLNAHVK